MFVLRVNYLMGRVYSAVFEDGDAKRVPEWPPHPSRLFSALVAAWGDGGAEEELKPALKWLEEQASPVIYAGRHSPRWLVQSFVPVNDYRSLPEDRSRKPRAFPSASLTHPDVYFVWDTADPSSETSAALERILRRTSSLGHPASLVAVEIASAPPEDGLTIWRPTESRGTRMRVTHSGRLQDLCNTYDRFQMDPIKTHRPSRGKTVLYSQISESQSTVIRGVFDEMIVLRRDAGPKASLRSTLSVLAALRGAIQKYAPDPVPEYLSGHAPESTPVNPVRSEKPHVALVPLPFVAAQRATGEILGAALLLPNTLTADQKRQCWDVAASIDELGMPWGRWTVSVADAEEHRRTLRSEMWAVPHTQWSTVTPFVFDKYPKDPYGGEAERIVRAAFHRVGLPEPSAVALHYNPWHMGVPKAALFPPAPARVGKPQRYHCHVLAKFEQSVTGPMIAGAGRYYGYGFFAPLTER